MKRMVKNGDLIDVEPDGTITVAGKPIGGGGGLSDVIETDGKTTTIKSALQVTENINTSKNLIFKDKQAAQIQKCNGIYFVDGFSIKEDYSNKGISFYNYNQIPNFILYGKVSKFVISYSCDASFTSGTGNLQFKSANKDAIYSGFRSRIPEPPTSEGTYRLVATVSSTGELSFTWANN